MIRVGKLAEKRASRHMSTIIPMYERSERACARKGQTHLRNYEKTTQLKIIE